MVYQPKSLFRGLGDDDQKKLRDILDGLKNGAKVEIAEPVMSEPSADITPRPMMAVPGDEPLARSNNPYTPNPSVAPVPIVPGVNEDQALQNQMFRMGGATDQSPTSYEQSPQDQAFSTNLPNSLERPDMYAGKGTASDRDPNAPPRTSGKIGKEIEDLKDYKDPHKHSLLGRLFKGIAKGYQQWDGQGGLFGLGAATLGPGIGSAASPKIYEGLERKGKENKLFREQGLARQQEDFESKQATQAAQRQNLGNQILTRSATAINQNANRDATTANTIANTKTDNAREDYKVQREERKRTRVERNGKYYNRDAEGTETPLYDDNGEHATELNKVPIATTLADGTPIYTTGDKALDREITQNLNQSRMDFDAAKLNQADLDKYEQDVTKTANDIAEHKTKVSKHILDGQALQNEAAGYEDQAKASFDPKNTDALMAKAHAARSKGNALVDQGNELSRRPPKMPKRPSASLAAPNLKVGTYSEGDFTDRAKAKGITGQALKAAIAKARQDGVIK